MNQSLDLVALAICVALVIYMPISGLRSHRRLLQWTAEGRPDARTRAYRKVLLSEWGLTVGLLAWWFLSGRTAAEIRLSPFVDGWRLITVGVGLAACAYLILQMRSVLRNVEQLEHLREAARELLALVPRSPHEVRMFDAVSLTAGVCEEILYRGILLTVVAGWVGTPWSMVLTSLAFGLGHAYQGRRGVVKTSMVGGLMAVLTVFSGTVWIAVLVHWTIDATSGRMLTAALDTSGPTKRSAHGDEIAVR